MGITLFLGAILEVVLPTKNTLGGMMTTFLWSVTLAVLAITFAVFTFSLLILNLSLLIRNRRAIPFSSKIRIWLMFLFAVTSGLLMPPATNEARNIAILISSRMSFTSERNREFEEICNRMFAEKDYIQHLLEASDSIRIGQNSHAIVWADNSGDAIWFDTAGATSSSGIICIREGVPPGKAITDYDRRVDKGQLYHIGGTLYYWP
jgi:hypothetical protein